MCSRKRSSIRWVELRPRRHVSDGVSPLALAAALVAALNGGTAAPACETTDLMPVFWEYWERARDLGPADQFRLFEEMVQKPNAAVYEGAFSNAPKPPSDFVPGALAQVPELEMRMRALTAKLAADLPDELAAFRKAFPGFQCSVPVYFLVSGGAFDGATREVSGKTTLMFGLDVIARLNEELSPLVVHELFHVYHHEVVPDDPETVAWGLWSEGLATYVSRRLNPNIPEKDVCCLPDARAVKAALPRISKELLARLDSEDRADYARFFLGGQDLDIPQRSGYYVGYMVAEEAGKTRTLEQLAALTPAAVLPLEKAVLGRLAGAAPKDPR